MRSSTPSILAALILSLGACAVDVGDGDGSVADDSARIFDVEDAVAGDGNERDLGAADNLQAAAQANGARGDSDSPGVADLEAIAEPDPQPWEPNKRDEQDER